MATANLSLGAKEGKERTLIGENNQFLGKISPNLANTRRAGKPPGGAFASFRGAALLVMVKFSSAGTFRIYAFTPFGCVY